MRPIGDFFSKTFYAKAKSAQEPNPMPTTLTETMPRIDPRDFLRKIKRVTVRKLHRPL